MSRVFLVGCCLLFPLRPALAKRDGLSEVKQWGYQLQGQPRHPSDALDCLVVDAIHEGGFLPPQNVRALKQRAGKRDRVVLAYLSIGEAENYRYYWQKSWSREPPPFLSAENPAWKGNFKVRYWDPAWQAILIGYLDRILAAGFDGVYLDVIDAYEYFSTEARPIRRTAAKDMSQLVLRLAEHARVERRTPDFLIVPQNGALLPGELDAAGARAYLGAIDAIGAEDTFYFGDRPENNPLHVQTEVLAALDRFRAAGKAVLSVEYLTDPRKTRIYAGMARAHRFAPCVAPRSLERLLELSE